MDSEHEGPWFQPKQPVHWSSYNIRATQAGLVHLLFNEEYVNENKCRNILFTLKLNGGIGP